MKILIIEDEHPNFLRLKKLLKELDSSYTVEGPLISQSAVKDYFENGNRPDLIISDIRLSDGLVFDAFDDVNCDTRIIFTTAYSEYAVKAFQYNSIHYLLKPIDEGKLREVLGRAVGEAKKKKDGRRRQLFVRTKGRSLTIDQGDILYIESKAKKAEIHTVKETIEIYAAMSGLEEQLDERFYRCHRGYLVNMAYIVEYSADSISLAGGGTVYLTKKKHSEFVKAYMWFLQNGGVPCV